MHGIFTLLRINITIPEPVGCRPPAFHLLRHHRGHGHGRLRAAGALCLLFQFGHLQRKLHFHGFVSFVGPAHVPVRAVHQAGKAERARPQVHRAGPDAGPVPSLLPNSARTSSTGETLNNSQSNLPTPTLSGGAVAQRMGARRRLLRRLPAARLPERAGLPAERLGPAALLRPRPQLCRLHAGGRCERVCNFLAPFQNINLIGIIKTKYISLNRIIISIDLQRIFVIKEKKKPLVEKRNGLMLV